MAQLGRVLRRTDALVDRYCARMACIAEERLWRRDPEHLYIRWCAGVIDAEDLALQVVILRDDPYGFFDRLLRFRAIAPLLPPALHDHTLVRDTHAATSVLLRKPGYGLHGGDRTLMLTLQDGFLLGELPEEAKEIYRQSTRQIIQRLQPPPTRKLFRQVFTLRAAAAQQPVL